MPFPFNFPEDQMKDSYLYDRFQGAAFNEFESLCHRCGACCGAHDDPCSNLIREPGGRYVCGDYANRLASQKTLSGVSFNCVPIREHISGGTLRTGCGYAGLNNRQALKYL